MYTSVNQFALHFIQDPTVFYLIARTLSALLGTATIGVTYLIGKKVKKEATGLLAALFLACSYQHTILSHYGTVDIPMTFFFSLAVYQCITLFDRRSLWQYLLAGLATGLAIATKLNGIFAGIAFLSAHLLAEKKAAGWQKLFSPKLWLGAGAILIGHLIAGPYFYIDLKASLAEIWELRAMHASPGFHLMSYLKLLATYYWGAPVGAICLLGALQSVVSGSRKMAVLLLTALTVLCFSSLHQYVEAKYIIYSFPIFAVFGANLCTAFFSLFKKKYLYIIIPVLIVHPLYLIADWDYEHAQPSISLQARHWIEEHISINSRILLDNVGNKGPKLENSPENLRQQYQRALEHKLIKAEYLKLKLEASSEIYYDIVQINCPGGFRDDDYKRYCLWQDLEEIGHPPQYYENLGFEYIIVTDRYFSRMGKGFRLIKEFHRGRRGIRIYRLNPHKNKEYRSPNKKRDIK